MKALIALVVAAAAVVSAASAPAAATTADSYVSVAIRWTGETYGPRTAGTTVTVPTFSFRVGIYYKNLGPDAARVTIEFDLPAELHWGTDAPTAAQGCTSTATSARCTTPVVPVGGLDDGKDEYFTEWDVVADRPGSYVFHDAIVATSPSDPDTSNNASTVTALVKPALVATGLRVAPARPRAGSALTARLGFTAGGETVTPDSVTCTATIAGRRLAATASAATGAAACVVRIPRNARGKRIRGALSLSFGGATLTRRFAATIR